MISLEPYVWMESRTGIKLLVVIPSHSKGGKHTRTLLRLGDDGLCLINVAFRCKSAINVIFPPFRASTIFPR
jgi:hypothetical protein